MLAIRNALRNFRYAIDSVLGGGQFPPMSLNVIASSSAFPLSNSRDVSRPSSKLEDLLGLDLSVLWGMPTHKTTKATKITRKFAYNKLLKRKNNLIMCQNCGAWHEIHTICGKCYQAVREETNRIRDKLMAYNPYKGELPDKEAVLLYKGESVPEDGVWDGKRIIEMATERPTWFSRHLRQRWRLAAGIDTKPKNNNEAD